MTFGWVHLQVQLRKVCFTMEDLLSQASFVIVLVIAVGLWVLYHQLFHVVYFGNGFNAMFREFLVCIVGSLLDCRTVWKVSRLAVWCGWRAVRFCRDGAVRRDKNCSYCSGGHRCHRHRKHDIEKAWGHQRETRGACRPRSQLRSESGLGGLRNSCLHKPKKTSGVLPGSFAVLLEN